MKKRKAFFLFGIFVSMAFALIGWHEYFRPNPDMNSLTERFQLKSSGLIHEFEENDSLAGKKYIGTVVVVEGVLKQLLKDDRGYYTLVLGTKGNGSSVRCSLDTLHNAAMAGLAEGQIIAVKGAVTGFNADPTGLLGSDVLLNRCVLKNKN